MTAHAFAAFVGLLVLAAGATVERARRAGRDVRVRRRFGGVGSGALNTFKLPGAPTWLASSLADAEISLAADKAWLLWIAVALATACAGAALGGPVLAVGGAALGGIAPVLALRTRRGTAAATAEVSLPGALEAVARGLRSGGSLRQAIAEAGFATPGALGAELRAVSDAAERGTPLVDALEAWGERHSRPGVRLAVAALCLGAETGGAQARAIDGVAATLRERLAVAGEVRALTSQTRASMFVIAAAPVLFCVFASSTDPRTATFLFRDPVGLACLAAGITLDLLGAVWMRRLCRVTA